MKLRHKTTKLECTSQGFNIHSINEIIIGSNNGELDSDYIRNFEVWLEKQNKWIDLNQAFRDGFIEVDEYHSNFWEKK